MVKNLKYLIEDQHEEVSVLANAAAYIKEQTGYFWVGFYLVRGDQLVLGPFQGSVACYTIRRGRGVCGTCWERGETLLVPDVHEFPGHIACSSLSESEIVIPLKDQDGTVRAVLDIDSDRKDDFTEEMKAKLEQMAVIISQQIYCQK